jgi:hypothetical protein
MSASATEVDGEEAVVPDSGRRPSVYMQRYEETGGGDTYTA